MSHLDYGFSPLEVDALLISRYIRGALAVPPLVNLKGSGDHRTPRLSDCTRIIPGQPRGDNVAFTHLVTCPLPFCR